MKAVLNRPVKLLICATILVVLLLPVAQDLTGFKSYIRPLRGDFVPVNDTTLTWSVWFSGKYGTKKESYLKENFGLHNYYILLNNEVNFRLFNKAQIVYVVAGYDNCMFETGYFDAYFGTDFVGKDSIDHRTRLIKDLQDTLRKSHKIILPVIAPGKAGIFPENIPKKYQKPAGISNYLYMTARFDHDSIKYIDFHKDFIRRKHSEKYPLYPHYGIHWSNYASLKALDSIIHFVSLETGECIPRLIPLRTQLSNELQHPDNDIGVVLNLLRPLHTYPMAYTDYAVEDSTNCKPLNLLVVADSYWWQIYETALPEKIFANNQFWFYNRNGYGGSKDKPFLVKEIDYESAIRKADVILVLYSQGTLKKFGSGFLETAWDTYFRPKKKPEKNPGSH